MDKGSSLQDRIYLFIFETSDHVEWDTENAIYVNEMQLTSIDFFSYIVFTLTLGLCRANKQNQNPQLCSVSNIHYWQKKKMQT